MLIRGCLAPNKNSLTPSDKVKSWIRTQSAWSEHFRSTTCATTDAWPQTLKFGVQRNVSQLKVNFFLGDILQWFSAVKNYFRMTRKRLKILLLSSLQRFWALKQLYGQKIRMSGAQNRPDFIMVSVLVRWTNPIRRVESDQASKMPLL